MKMDNTAKPCYKEEIMQFKVLDTFTVIKINFVKSQSMVVITELDWYSFNLDTITHLNLLGLWVRNGFSAYFFTLINPSQTSLKL